MMRDLGYNFQWHDKYAEPYLARGFEWDGSRKDLLVIFEVFEHFSDPMTEIKKLLSISDDVIFTTTIYGEDMRYQDKDWWYYAQYAGQHISFFSRKTIEYIAGFFRMKYYFLGNYHWLTKKQISHSKIKCLWKQMSREKIRWVKNLDYKYAAADSEFLINKNKE